MKKQPTIGTEELRLLRFIAERGPTTVREASETFGAETGVRLTTVQQMMERLRTKGYLVRTPHEVAFKYSSRLTTEELMEGVVREFVEGSLGGSLNPFALYLTKNPKISEQDLAELRRIVNELSEERDAK